MKCLQKILLTGACMLALGGVLTSCERKEDPAITVYTRDTKSGTRDGFFTGIGFSEAKSDNTVLVGGYQEVGTNGAMMAAIKADEYGIGYISLSALTESGLKGLNYEGVEPNSDNVINGSYNLTRNFNYIIRDDDMDSKSGQIVRAMVAYLDTIEGKALISNNGGIVDLASSDKSWDDIKVSYPICNEDNSSITIKIAGSTSVKEITSKLLPAFSSLCGNFKYEFNQNGSGDAFKRTQGSEKDGANRADIAFASREFKADSEKYAPGTAGKMCIDAIVAVVNESNSYSNTTASELKSIYDGSIKTWSEIK